MLKLFAHSGFVAVHELRNYDQRPFRSMILRGYVAYHPKKGFKITQKGEEAWETFNQTQIIRMRADAPLTSAVNSLGFDASSWGLAPREPRAKGTAA